MTNNATAAAKAPTMASIREEATRLKVQNRSLMLNDQLRRAVAAAQAWERHPHNPANQ